MGRVATSHEAEVDVVVLIKAAPEIGRKHGETVCVAGIDSYGKWHRLYPVPFRDLDPHQKFKRWDRIRVRWRKPFDDNRIESKRIDPQSLRIVSEVKGHERHELAARAVVQSLEIEKEQGRSLALIRPQNTRFVIKRQSEIEFQKAVRRRSEIIRQTDMFAQNMLHKKPPPFSFFYEFDHANSRRRHLCIDWETEQTFFNWRRKYGEEKTLSLMQDRWGDEMPSRGLLFAMGTHRVKMFNSWLLSGILQSQEPKQALLTL